MDIEIENEADLIAMLKKISPFFKWDGLLHVLEGKVFMIGVGSALISLFLVLGCYSLTLTAKRADENLLMICEQNQKN